MVVAQSRDDFLDEILMVYQIGTSQMENSRTVAVDEVMDLLAKSIIVDYVDDQIRKNLDRFVMFQLALDLFDPRRAVAKDHRHP